MLRMPLLPQATAALQWSIPGSQMDTSMELPVPGLLSVNGSPATRSLVKISNITNSNDPKAVNSRVFVGNLNTFALSKEDVEGVFKRYGHIIGISMHKGYAFIQYMNELESRNAVAGEDQRIYAGQQIDVNLAAEPKTNRPKRKRPQGAGAEWDYYYNVPVLPNGLPLQCHIPLPKRPRPDMTAPALNPALPSNPQIRNHPLVAVAGNSFIKSNPPASRKTYSVINRKRTEEPDILICGNCKQSFADIDKLADHKKVLCRFRFVCRCHELAKHRDDKTEPTSLICATCRMTLTSPWELLQHSQNDHGVNLYINSHDTTSEVEGSKSQSPRLSPSQNPAVTEDGADSHLKETSLSTNHDVPYTPERPMTSPGTSSLASDISSVTNDQDPTTAMVTTSINGHDVMDGKDGADIIT